MLDAVYMLFVVAVMVLYLRFRFFISLVMGLETKCKGAGGNLCGENMTLSEAFRVKQAIDSGKDNQALFNFTIWTEQRLIKYLLSRQK